MAFFVFEGKGSMAHIPRRFAVTLLDISKSNFDHWHELYDPSAAKPRRYRFADLVLFALIRDLVKLDGNPISELKTSISQETLLSLREALIEDPHAPLWFHYIRRQKKSYWETKEEMERDPKRFEGLGRLSYEIQPLREQLIARFQQL